MSPLATLLELIGAVGLLFYATRLEHAREADDAPRIIKPFALPEKPRRHWFWLKVAMAISLLAGFGAVVVAISMRHVMTARPQAPAGAKPVGRGDDGTSTKSAATPTKLLRTQITTAATPINRTGKSTAPASSPPAHSVTATAEPPDSPITVTNMVPEGAKAIAMIGGKRVDAAAKPPGTVYVSVLISSVTRYTGMPNLTTIRKVVDILKNMPGVQVFFADSGYILSRGGVHTSFGGLDRTSGSLLFYDQEAEDAARRTQEALKGIIDIKHIQRGGIPGGSDASRLLYKDFFASSGLDIELTL